MAVDLQIVFPMESIKLNAIRPVSMGGVQALAITGEDFRAVDEVLINDIPSPDVVVPSKTQLIAQLPEIMQKAGDVRSVVVLSRRFTISTRSVLRFRVGDRPGKVRGIQRLVQLFVKILFQTPGSDIFNKNGGGGLMNKVGTTFGVDQSNNLLTDIVVCIQRTQRQIISMQGQNQRTPRDERLASATVVGSNFDKVLGAFYVTLEIVSQAGTSATVNWEM